MARKAAVKTEGAPKKSRTASDITRLTREHGVATKAWAKAVAARNKVANTDELDAAVDAALEVMNAANDALRSHLGVED